MNLKRLIVIDGAAGTGKSDLLEFVEHQLTGYNTAILKKFSTRDLRPEEARKRRPIDLELVDDKTFDELQATNGFYSYIYPRHNGHRYGFSKSSIEKLFKSVDNIFLIVRSATTIKKLMFEFPDVVVIPFFVYTIETLIAERLRNEGCTEKEIQYRIERSPDALDDLYTHPTLYHRVIVNNSDKTVYQRQLKDHFESLLQKSNEYLQFNARLQYQLPNVLQPYKNNMINILSDHKFEKNIFLMMDFEIAADDCYETIQKIIVEKGYNCVRADMATWSITNDDVYNPFAVLYCCKFGIALFNILHKTDSYNVNVAIELAMMHFQNKQCLVLKHESLPAPPFDLASKIFKNYRNSNDLKNIINNWLNGLKN